MPIYIARCRTPRGPKEVEIEANSEADARKQAGQVGQILTVKRQYGLTLRKGLSPEDRQTFLQRLSAMLASRVGTGEALALMRDTFSGRIRSVSGTLLRRIEAGADIAEAMEAIGQPDFPEATIALIRAGARGGETWRALQDAARFELELNRIRRSAGKGLWVAIGGFFGAGILTLYSTKVLGPQLMESSIMQSQSQNLDIDWVYTTADVMTIVMGILMVGFLFLLWLGTMGRRMIPNAADNLILKIPYYKDLILAKNNYTVLYGLSLLIHSGVRIEEALKLSADAAPKGALRTDLERAIRAVRSGKPWAMAMQTLHPTDKAALTTSQDREQVAASLDVLSGQYRDMYNQRLASFVPIMQLVAALFLTLSGGVLFGITILPMLQVSNSIL